MLQVEGFQGRGVRPNDVRLLGAPGVLHSVMLVMAEVTISVREKETQMGVGPWDHFDVGIGVSSESGMGKRYGADRVVLPAILWVNPALRM